MSVLTVRSVPGRALGMVTLGALPNVPVAVTAVFAPAPLTLPPEADADAEEDEDEDEEELDFDDPQPARATPASRGMAMSARKRRMKKPRKWWMSAPPAYWPCRPGGTTPRNPPGPGGDPPDPPSHAGDQLLDPLVDRAERVFAQHGPLGLVVQLEVHPVDGEVASLLLRPADELAAQLGPGGLRRDRLGLEDVDVTGRPLDGAVALEQVVQAAAAVYVVVGQVELGHPGRGQRQVVPGPVPLDELVLGHPVDLPGDHVEIAGLDRGQRPL